jgi:hypothetical protein
MFVLITLSSAFLAKVLARASLALLSLLLCSFRRSFNSPGNGVRTIDVSPFSVLVVDLV